MTGEATTPAAATRGDVHFMSGDDDQGAAESSGANSERLAAVKAGR